MVINIKSQKDKILFSTLANRLRLKSRILSEEDKEDSALLAMMYDRENEKTLPVETTHRILDKIIKK